MSQAIAAKANKSQNLSRTERRARKYALRYEQALAMARKRWPAIAAEADAHPFVEAAVLARNRPGNLGFFSRINNLFQSPKSRYLATVERWFVFPRGFMGMMLPENPLEDWRLSLLKPATVQAANVLHFLTYRLRLITLSIYSFIGLMGVLISVSFYRNGFNDEELISLAVGLVIGIIALRCSTAISVSGAMATFQMRINNLDNALRGLHFNWKVLLSIFGIYIGIIPIPIIIAIVVRLVGPWGLLFAALFGIALLLVFFPRVLDRWVNREFIRRATKITVALDRIYGNLEKKASKTGR